MLLKCSYWSRNSQAEMGEKIVSQLKIFNVWWWWRWCHVTWSLYAHHHNHHQVTLMRHILSLSLSLSLSIVVRGGSSEQHPVSAKSWWMFVGQRTLVCVCVGACRKTLLTSSCLLVQHVLFVLLWWFRKWETDYYKSAGLWCASSRICSEPHAASLRSSSLAFFSECFITV